MSDRDFQALAATAVESRLWAAMRGVATAWTAAWNDSAVVRTVMRLVQPLSGSGEAERVRYGAMIVASAALAHLGALAVIPAYAAPAVPRIAVAGVAIAAAVIAAMPEPFAKAWTDSQAARAWRRLLESD